MTASSMKCMCASSCTGSSAARRSWPTLWREAVTLHCSAVFGVDLTDDSQRAVLEEEAYEATREAEAVRYEERYVEETYVY